MSLNKENFVLGRFHTDLIKDLLFRCPNSFLVYFEDEQRALSAGSHWSFIEFVDSLKGLSVHDTTCNELVEHGIIVPELEDDEYKIQKAIGTQIGRVYKLSYNFRKIFEDYFLTKKIEDQHGK